MTISEQNIVKRENNMSYTDFVQEIYRAYDVLGEQAEIQNHNDIKSWINDGLISEINAIELNRLNRKLYTDKAIG